MQAREQGFTEPDPRDDLNGLDVARKVTTLARECGLMVELSDVPVDNLVPEALRSAESADAYLSALPEYDAEMAKKAEEAAANGEVLRYVGVVDIENKKCSVELRRYPNTHAFATLSGSDNIILFNTIRYSQQPLIVRGPGAGAEVTAGGVFGDMLRLAAHLGGPST
uniref:Homoserine dehydrogenase n=1 Tax=Tetraselmis sp. GSL018 TaxID=582737 RepID=A0A061R1N3_9CHLO